MSRALCSGLLLKRQVGSAQKDEFQIQYRERICVHGTGCVVQLLQHLEISRSREAINASTNVNLA